MRNLLLAPYGVDELLLHTPASLLFGRDGDFGQPGVAAPSAVEGHRAAVDPQGALGAEEPRLGGWRQAENSAHAEPGDGAGLQLAQHLYLVGYGNVARRSGVVPARLHVYAGQGGDARGVSHPAHHRLVPNAHAHYVVAAQVAIVPPVEGRVTVDEAALPHRDIHRQYVSQVAVSYQLLDCLIHLQRHGRGDYLRDEVGLEPRGV